MPSTLPSVNPCCDSCNGMVVEYNPPTPGGQEGWFVVNNKPDLRALPNLSTNRFAEVLGGVVPDDGFGGGYSWRATAYNADDDADWIKPNDTNIGDPGRWKYLS